MSGKSRALPVNWLGTAGCLYIAVSLVGGTTGQVPNQSQIPADQQPAGLDVGGARPASFDRQLRDGLSAEKPGQSGYAMTGAITPMLVGEGFIAFASPDGAGGHQVILVHEEREWMAVYRVPADGRIELQSSRQLTYDFELTHNATAPTPDAIHQLNRVREGSGEP